MTFHKYDWATNRIIIGTVCLLIRLANMASQNLEVRKFDYRIRYSAVFWIYYSGTGHDRNKIPMADHHFRCHGFQADLSDVAIETGSQKILDGGLQPGSAYMSVDLQPC